MNNLPLLSKLSHGKIGRACAGQILPERSGANGQRKPASILVRNVLRGTPVLMLIATLLVARFGGLFEGVF